MATATADAGVGALLRDWRERRRRSQLDLALEAGISAKHLSFVETGRSTPSPRMIVKLASELDVPHRDRNRLLLAAGYAPLYAERSLEAEEMTPVRQAIEQVLSAHEPYPAVVVDGHWNLLASNDAVGALLEGVSPALLEPPANVLRISLHPDGMAPRIVNLGEWRGHLLQRLRRQIALSGDPELVGLAEEAQDWPAGRRARRAARAGDRRPASPAHENGGAGLLQHDHNLRHGGRDHDLGDVDRIVLPRRPREHRRARVH